MRTYVRARLGWGASARASLRACVEVSASACARAGVGESVFLRRNAGSLPLAARGPKILSLPNERGVGVRARTHATFPTQTTPGRLFGSADMA